MRNVFFTLGFKFNNKSINQIMKNEIYVAYVIETYRHNDEPETNTVELVRAFGGREIAKGWAHALHELHKKDYKEYGNKFYWQEWESCDDYSATCTEYWDGNKNVYVESFDKCTRRIEIKVCSVSYSDEMSDPSDDIMNALVG